MGLGSLMEKTALNKRKGKIMLLTEKNIRVADKIVGILISEKCTVSEAQHILHSI